MRKVVALYLLLQLAEACSCCVLGFRQEGIDRSFKRPVQVADAIEMRQIGEHDYSLGVQDNLQLAHFSPDGKRFVVVVKKGNLEKNTNEFSMWLFKSADSFRSPQPELLLTMSSDSSREAIKDPQWLDDEDTIAFLGENPGEVPQVFSLEIKSRKLKKLTDHRTPVFKYAISGDGQTIVFEADPADEKIEKAESGSGAGVVVTTQNIETLLTNSGHNIRVVGEGLFIKVGSRSEKEVAVDDLLFPLGAPALSISDDGRFAVFDVKVRDLPSVWAGYKERFLHDFFGEKRLAGMASRLTRYMVLDVRQGTLEPLLNAPEGHGSRLMWARDGDSIIVTNSYLPLDLAAPDEREARENNTYTVEIKLPSRDYIKLAAENVANRTRTSQPFAVRLDESFDRPPRIYVSDPVTKVSALLWDLNPQFSVLAFGRVEAITWRSKDDHEVLGGLYWPLSYEKGRRYPLVIQSHGFNAKKFAIDGPWSSAFAAQPLVSQGFVVLQLGFWKDQALAHATNTPEEGPLEMAAVEGAIDYLDQLGLIDRERVGIIGFSRTVFSVAYTLTHSKYKFAGALLTDGIDGGHLQYLSSPLFWHEFDELMGGPPFGSTLRLWLERSPGFNLDKVEAPVRLVALGPASVLLSWEWYSGLKRLGKPVDFIYLPNAPHLITRPSERVAAQQGLVDWFRFWLKSEEDPAPAKAGQYVRWRKLQASRPVGENGSAGHSGLEVPEL